MIDRILVGYMVLVGAATGIALALYPELREWRVPPYFWVLIALAAFELVNVARGAAGAAVSMPARLAGFVLGVVLMVTIPLVLGPLLRS